jgi:hypothetical protein
MFSLDPRSKASVATQQLALEDLLRECAQTIAIGELRTISPADLFTLGRAVERRLREAGAGIAAFEIARLLDLLAEASALPLVDAQDALHVDARSQILLDLAAAIRAGRQALPADAPGIADIALRRAGAMLSRALEGRRLASPTRQGAQAWLRLIATALPQLNPAGTAAIASQLDNLASGSQGTRAPLLDDQHSPPSIASLRDVLTNATRDLATPAELPLPSGWPAGGHGLASPRWRRLLHVHIPKCGGTSMNAWLDTLAGDARSWNPRHFRSLREARLYDTSAAPERLRQPPDALEEAGLGRAVFHMSDIVYSHIPLLAFAPAGTLRMTILRSPVERVVSQVADWRRLRPEDVVREDPATGAAVLDSGRLALRPWLERHGRASPRVHVDNTMTRLLAASRIGAPALDTADEAILLAAALESLEHDFELVGLTELHDLARNAIAEKLGVPPVGAMTKLNQTGSAQLLAEEIDDAAAMLAMVTGLDQQIYDRAVQIFDERHRAAAENWTDAAFESRDALAATESLRPIVMGDAFVHSVRGPLLGRGFYSRDGAGTANCAVWSGPEEVLILYMPVPVGAELEILVWVRGYAKASQRNELRVRLDGIPLQHALEPCPGWADRLVCRYWPRRPFVRIEVEVGPSLVVPGDPRPRGFAFDAFGWRLA